MIVRVFASSCDLGKMEKFYLSKALPILKKQKGCILAIAGRDNSSKPPKIAMVSVWESLDALKAFTGQRYKRPKMVPEEKPLLLGTPILENFEILGTVSKRKRLNWNEFVTPTKKK